MISTTRTYSRHAAPISGSACSVYVLLLVYSAFCHESRRLYNARRYVYTAVQSQTHRVTDSQHDLS